MPTTTLISVAMALALASCQSASPPAADTTAAITDSAPDATQAHDTAEISATPDTATTPTCPPGTHAQAGLGCASALTAWTAGPKLKHKRDHHVTLVAETQSGPYLFVLAGAGSAGGVLQVERSAIAADGSLADFEDVGKLPKALIGPGMAQLGTAFVLAGGLGDDSASVTDTFVGTIDANGEVALQKGPPLANSRYHVALVYAKGFVFAAGGLFQGMAGGVPDQKVLDAVERAPFDGTTLGPFVAQPPLPGKLTHHAMLFYQDAIYVLGGGAQLAATTDILRATVSATGELGPWQKVGALALGIASPAATVVGQQVYVVAGMTSLTQGEQSGVLRADFGANGTIGPFTAMPPLPLQRAHSHQAPYFNGWLYSAGGSIEHVPQGNVYVGSLQ